MVTSSDSTDSTSSQSQTANHTPGPWRTFKEHDESEWWLVTTDFVGGKIIANVNEDCRQEANARLIAAAPDLLAKLQQFVKWTELHKLNMADCIDGVQRECPVIINARLAIAKATGDVS